MGGAPQVALLHTVLEKKKIILLSNPCRSTERIIIEWVVCRNSQNHKTAQSRRAKTIFYSNMEGLK